MPEYTRCHHDGLDYNTIECAGFDLDRLLLPDLDLQRIIFAIGKIVYKDRFAYIQILRSDIIQDRQGILTKGATSRVSSL